MKRIVLLIGLAFVAQAWAQDQKPAAKPAAENPKPAVQASAKTRKPNPSNPKRSEDARHCLDRPTNTEVIKCAEEYL